MKSDKMRICECDPFNKCPDCESRYLLTATRANDGYDLFYCFSTREEMERVYNIIESTNEFMGESFRPKSAIRFHPVNERND